MRDGRRPAYALALLIPGGLLAGALIAEHHYGLPPCEMCWWQRYPHMAALILGAAAWASGRDLLARLAAAAILVSGAIGAFHAGVEYGWWQGITHCASTATGDDPLASIMNAPLVRCDVAPWGLAGVSLAGWNFLISAVGGATILWLLRSAPERRAVTA